MRSLSPFLFPMCSRRSCRSKGSAMIELVLLSPWLFFLFVGVVDMGFFCYDLIAVENAARVGAEYASKNFTTASDSTGTCTRVLAELASLPNVNGLSVCTAAPLTVTASSISGPDGNPATSVSVTYQSPGLIPIPGLLMKQLNVTRNVQMRVYP